MQSGFVLTFGKLHVEVIQRPTEISQQIAAGCATVPSCIETLWRCVRGRWVPETAAAVSGRSR